MCFAIPKKVHSVEGDCIVTTDGIRAKHGGIKCLVGDYVLIYGDVVVEKIPSKQAEKVLKHLHKSGTDQH
ncbi:hypothetical protein CO051_04795 [Candidatus Roizmanbacteria bacterium CG_4_9_14_0_2_um_filter_39_13]|uniref:HypC/HybG/HupF family hydrogenase formation chaperone n=2 Tax=Candidatus Roizmaniibacteriota TaxID=1752723 RepID=A0A2M8EXS2_9BACT|nr:MAG: hypothetical protein COY15_05025 [Candidatus Roizmanbacteria bacterium CG_4_10_14_0_2_um_filter_39_12]PJC30931.1 MAG: hypothetical protein CO051_04795 [Candidatus Roizmanbacteria bacterium CG_4_9_14_0_2_um_filter_39_13]PJE61975.1 MAG: hypothetical protein COU87_01760 [Candidatus Roizmanbacteria bacterium CG10_big_fil_rev_8_21_14_0_10_39_12]